MSSAEKIHASRPCPISGSNDVIIVSSKDRHGESLRNVLCEESGLIYVDPVPFENTEEFYQTEYRKSYKGVHEPKSKHVYRAGKIALERMSRISKFLPKSAECLDAGSSSGEFVYLLNSKGFKSQGVEANMPYATYSINELGIGVKVCPFSQFQTDTKFDLISMFHVLEHLENPVRDLSHLGKFLKSNGKLVIEVPNILYPDMAFSHKWHPGHLFSFTEHTLMHLVEKAGFRTISCNPINDGGNLWGIFEYKQESEGNSSPQFSDSSEILNKIYRGKNSYHLRFWNYLKFLPKAVRQISEKVNSGGLSGKQILDNLYS